MGDTILWKGGGSRPIYIRKDVLADGTVRLSCNGISAVCLNRPDDIDLCAYEISQELAERVVRG